MAITSPRRRSSEQPRHTWSRASDVRAESNTLWLSSFVALAALAVSAIGLFWEGPSGPSTFTTIHGETVDLYGHGLYRYDSLIIGAGFRGTDAITLFIGVPLLIGAIIWFRHGSLRGQLLLTGVLSYMLYVYASMALGAAFNGLFLAYIGIFSASLFALGLTLLSIDVDRLGARFTSRTPHRGMVIFLLMSGFVTAVVWLLPLVTEMLNGDPPKLLDNYTTVVTDVLDLGIITPLLFVSGALIHRRITAGYLIAVPLIGIIVVLAPSIVAATISQQAAGVEFTPGEIIGPISGFTLLGAFAIGLLFVLLRSIRESSPA